MRKLLPLVLCTLLITGCVKTDDATVSYKLTTDLTDASRIETLPTVVQRLLENRLIALDSFAREVKVTPEGDDYMVTVTLSGSNMTVLDTLTERITEPLTIRFMKEVPLEEADIIIADTEGYKETMLTEDHIVWLTHRTHPVLKNGEVIIEFSEKGKELRKQIFEENKGNNIGVFVKGRPIYKLLVDENDEEDTDTVVLRNIPNPEMAQIFADDMNVGLHVTFSPVQ